MDKYIDVANVGVGVASLAALSQVRQAWLAHRADVDEKDMKRRLGIAVLMSGVSRIRVFNKNVVTIDPEGIRLEVFLGRFFQYLTGDDAEAAAVQRTFD